MNILTSSPPLSSDTITLVITEVIEDTICITCGDGQKVYERIAEALQEGKKIIVSFKDAEDITSAFLAQAIGQLYHKFPEELVESSLSVVDIQPIDALDLEDTIHWTKRYLQDPERYMAAAREAFGEDFERE